MRTNHHLLHLSFGLLATALLASACGGEDLSGLGGDELAGFEQGGDETAADEAAILGSDACKGADIQVTNSYEVSGSDRRMKVLKFEYYSASEGRWLTELVTDQEIAYGRSAWFTDQDLQYAENDLITEWKVHFKYLEFDGDWSDEMTQTVNTTDVICRADQDFFVRVD